MALARVEEEIIRQKLVLSNLYLQRNYFSFVFRLSDEILTTIFVYCARNGQEPFLSVMLPLWVKISHVCRHWRSVTLNCRAFWTHIPSMPFRWIEEFLVRSGEAPLEICIERDSYSEGLPTIMEKVMNHVEHIQELSLTLSSKCTDEALFKLSSCASAPRLQTLKILSTNSPTEVSTVLFDGDTPALRTLELSRCSTPWYSLKLSALTTLHLSYVPVQFQQFMATLTRMQDLTHLHLIRSLPDCRAFISTPAFNTFQKINLPHISSLQINAPPSAVIAFLSCANIPLDAKVRLEFDPKDHFSFDDYAPLFSLLAGRFSIFEDQAQSAPTIRSLILKLYHYTRISFSTLERHHPSCDAKPWDRNIPLEIRFVNPSAKYRIASDICSLLPLSHVQSVDVESPPIFPAFWKDVLGHLEGLRYLKLSNSDMPELASVLYVAPQDSAEEDGMTGGGRHQMVAPALEELELSAITFQPDPLEGDDTRLGGDQQSLENAVLTRKDPPLWLTMTDCRVYTRPDYEAEAWAKLRRRFR